MKKLIKSEALEFLKLTAGEYDALLAEAKSKKHSDLSASASERWLNCPASVHESKKAKEEAPNIYALEGTLAHKYLEEWLLKLKRDQFTKAEPRGLKRNKDMFLAVKSAVEFIRHSYSEKKTDLVIEEKADLSFIHESMFGTSDIGLVSEFDTLEVWDYKHGKGHIVEPFEKTEYGLRLNSQLMFYLIGFAHKYHYDFRSYLVGIIQPRAEGAERIDKSVEVTKRDIDLFVDLFRSGVDRVYSKHPKHFVGRWCKWCRGKEFCPKQEKIKYEKSRDMFAEIGE